MFSLAQLHASDAWLQLSYTVFSALALLPLSSYSVVILICGCLSSSASLVACALLDTEKNVCAACMAPVIKNISKAKKYSFLDLKISDNKVQ